MYISIVKWSKGTFKCQLNSIFVFQVFHSKSKGYKMRHNFIPLSLPTPIETTQTSVFVQRPLFCERILLLRLNFTLLQWTGSLSVTHTVIIPVLPHSKSLLYDVPDQLHPVHPVKDIRKLIGMLYKFWIFGRLFIMAILNNSSDSCSQSNGKKFPTTRV